MAEQTIRVDEVDKISGLFGSFDENIRIIEREFGVQISNRGGAVKVTGGPEEVDKAVRALRALVRILGRGEGLSEQSVQYVVSLVNDGIESQAEGLGKDIICVTAEGKPVRPRTIGQKAYVQAIRDNTVVLAVGPAGTGKTYLAVAMAVAAFRAKEVARIVLTRPAVEAGEKLGFLPGDLQTKVDPYLRPLYDALFEMLGSENYQRLTDRQIIEVAPLAYMRGRTLGEAFIILDEAQNTTPEQMKMFLTRLGLGSKAVITGDITQIDLPGGERSGLVEATHILANIEGIAIQYFTGRDVVRHRLVQKIIKAYETYEREGRQNK